MQDIVTDYKNIVRGNSEIPISSCPFYIEDRIYGSGNATPNEAEDYSFGIMTERLEVEANKRAGKTKPKKKQKKETRYQKIEKIKKDNPGCKIFFATVDTNNEFEFLSGKYAISPSVKGYQPKQVGCDLLYDMDKIVVVYSEDNRKFYYDQELFSIDENLIKKIS